MYPKPIRIKASSRLEFWAILKQLREELSLLQVPDKFIRSDEGDEYLTTYAKRVYGIQIETTDEGYYRDKFSVVDESKYTLFVLKFGDIANYARTN